MSNITQSSGYLLVLYKCWILRIPTCFRLFYPRPYKSAYYQGGEVAVLPLPRNPPNCCAIEPQSTFKFELPESQQTSNSNDTQMNDNPGRYQDNRTTAEGISSMIGGTTSNVTDAEIVVAKNGYYTPIDLTLASAGHSTTQDLKDFFAKPVLIQHEIFPFLMLEPLSLVFLCLLLYLRIRYMLRRPLAFLDLEQKLF